MRAGYQPSEALLERLTLRRRRIVHPLQARPLSAPLPLLPLCLCCHCLCSCLPLRNCARCCASAAVPDGGLRAQNDLAVRPEPSRQLKQ